MIPSCPWWEGIAWYDMAAFTALVPVLLSSLCLTADDELIMIDSSIVKQLLIQVIIFLDHREPWGLKSEKFQPPIVCNVFLGRNGCDEAEF